MTQSGLGGLDAVLAVARLRNFRAAAAELSVSTSALSHAVAAVETKLGVRLFNRTTRSVSMSEAGIQFVDCIAPAIAAIQSAMDQAGRLRETPAGTLRINTSLGAARQVMALLLSFLRHYPDMRLDIVTEGRQVDIVMKGFDAGIRLARSVPQDMIAVPFGRLQRFAVVGSPLYFAARGKPSTPDDLKEHACIRLRSPSGPVNQWEFSRRGKAQRVDVQGVITLDEPTLILEAVRDGLGLAYLTEWNVAADLDAGTLLRVLTDWTQPIGDLCLYYSGRRNLPAGLRALIDFIREKSAR